MIQLTDDSLMAMIAIGGDGAAASPIITIVGYVAAIIGAVFGYLRARELRKTKHHVLTAREEAEEAKARAAQSEHKVRDLEGTLVYVKKGITEPVLLEKGCHRNLIMLLGLGGTGKTQFIRTLFKNPTANPDDKTKTYQLYSNVMGFNRGGAVASGEATDRLHFFVCDYVGQNLSTLTSTFIVQQQRLYSQMAYGYINSLILMVDLRKPKKDKDDPEPPITREPDMDRIEGPDGHLAAWNQTAIDGIAGFLTEDTLRFVCLFINKLDLLDGQTPEHQERYQKMFSPLADRLRERFPQAKVVVLVGTVKHGFGIPTVENELISSSMLVKEDPPPKVETLHWKDEPRLAKQNRG